MAADQLWEISDCPADTCAGRAAERPSPHPPLSTSHERPDAQGVSPTWGLPLLAPPREWCSGGVGWQRGWKKKLVLAFLYTHIESPGVLLWDFLGEEAQGGWSPPLREHPWAGFSRVFRPAHRLGGGTRRRCADARHEIHRGGAPSVGRYTPSWCSHPVAQWRGAFLERDSSVKDSIGSAGARLFLLQMARPSSHGD